MKIISKIMNGNIDKRNQYWQAEINGKFLYHREDGPAIIFDDDTTIIEQDRPKQEWWYLGKKLDVKSQEEFMSLMKLKAFW